MYEYVYIHRAEAVRWGVRSGYQGDSGLIDELSECNEPHQRSYTNSSNLNFTNSMSVRRQRTLRRYRLGKRVIQISRTPSALCHELFYSKITNSIIVRRQRIPRRFNFDESHPIPTNSLI